MSSFLFLFGTTRQWNGYGASFSRQKGEEFLEEWRSDRAIVAVSLTSVERTVNIFISAYSRGI
jgi:hypothetical protein